MFPIMCDQLPCMNIALRMVIQRCPEVICAGIADHCMTNASPRISSRRNTKTFTAIMNAVMTGSRAGRREASLSGINPPT